MFSQGPVPPIPTAAVAIGLDHIPVAVRDLEAASATYRALGFSLKPGRPHANGIRNAHVKFPDGAGLELLTVPAAVDPLSTKYLDMIRAGDGPAFLSFHARDTNALHAALRAGGYAFRDANGMTDLSAPPFGFLFWIADNRSPTDRPEHFAHPNGATALGAVSIATDDGDTLARLLVALGGRQEHREVLAPDRVEATVVKLAEGDVVILPARHQLLPGRPIIGASFRVKDLATVRRALAAGRVSPRPGLELAERLVVEPSKAHGLWLEFVGRPSAPAHGRYLVTSSAIDVSLHIRLCVAVDPRDPQGVWWWQPGASGCRSRSTGPTVFHADRAAASPSATPAVTAVSFRLGLHSRTPTDLDVRLVVEDGRMRSLDTGAAVTVQRRNDLDVPEQDPAAVSDAVPNDTGLAVRGATRADADRIAGLMTELGYPTTAAQMTVRLDAILADDDYRTFLACDGSTIAGAIGTRTGPLYESDDAYGQIMVLVIADGHRRRGVGRLLLGAAEAYFIERRVRVAVVTSANRRADAHAFYEKYGYAFDGRRYKKPLNG